MEIISVLKVALPNLSYYKHRYNTCSPSVSYSVTAQLSISAFTIMLISRIWRVCWLVPLQICKLDHSVTHLCLSLKRIQWTNSLVLISHSRKPVIDWHASWLACWDLFWKSRACQYKWFHECFNRILAMLTAWLQQCGWTIFHTRWARSTWQLSMTETPSVHSFIFLPHIWVQVVGAPVQAEKPSPAPSSSTSWGTSSFSKASKEIQFLQQVLDMPETLYLGGI